METTLARAIYKQTEIGVEYTTSELFDLVGDDYYKYVEADRWPGQRCGCSVNAVVAESMWNVVRTGYAETRTELVRLPTVRGLKFGSKPTCYKEYTMRYWKRTK